MEHILTLYGNYTQPGLHEKRANEDVEDDKPPKGQHREM